jgi:hypothetical protein
VRHSRINKPAPNRRRLKDRRRQAVAHLVHLRRDGGAEIMITVVAIDRSDLDMRHDPNEEAAN